MSPDDDKTQYEVGDDEPAGEGEESAQRRHGHRLERGGSVEPLPLADDDAAPAREPAPARAAPRADVPERGSVKALDVCPNCGSTMGNSTAVVCMRCGYNLKTLKIEKTATGTAEPEPEDADEPETVAEPLARPGQGGQRLPLIAAAGAGALLSIGYLAGAKSLYPGADVPGFGGRLGAILGELIVVGLLAGSCLGALALLARYKLETRVGDLQLAAARVLGVVATARLAAYLPLDNRALANTFETPATAAIGLGLLMYFFALDVVEAGVAVFTTFMIFVTMMLGAAAVYWGVW